ncbi:MAG: PIG-L family deacetylase [Hymenobacter sp.]
MQVVVDQWAALELTRIRSPWLVGMCAWDGASSGGRWSGSACAPKSPFSSSPMRTTKTVALSDLLVEAGSAYNLNLKIFNAIQRTITGWPGGKPNSNDAQRPERAVPALKTSLIFSPHPDDDVISMGGTLLRLVDQGHDVHVAYQTSGNIAVFDDDARRFADFAFDFAERHNIGVAAMRREHAEVVEFLQHKKLGEEDSPLVQNIKALIRKGEAEAACRFCGVKAANVHFMNLPFYETGQVKKKPLGEADIEETMALLQELRPQQIFAAGDLRDPTARTACAWMPFLLPWPA